jgi:hypothetical protein
MMLSVLALLIWNAFPRLFPADAHALLGAMPLALAAVSAVVYQAARRPSGLEVFKVVVLAAAFLFWAINQLLGDSTHALLFNDLAIALFALDVFLTVVFWPPRVRSSAASDAATQGAHTSSRSSSSEPGSITSGESVSERR